MTMYTLVALAREYAERLRKEARSMGFSQADIDAHKHKPMDLGGQMHVAWLKMRMASEIDTVANIQEAEARIEPTPTAEE